MSSTSRPAWIRHDPAQISKAANQLPTFAQAAAAPVGDPRDPRTALIAAELAAAAKYAELEAHFTTALVAAEAETARWKAHALAVEAEAREQGYAAGYAEGEAQGRVTGEAAARAEFDAVVQLARQARVDMRRALQDAQAQLADLSLAIAHGIIGAAFAADPTLVAQRVGNLVQSISDLTQATVRVHPSDMAQVKALWPEGAKARRASDVKPRLVEDATITPGGCVIEARSNYLDGRWDALLDQARAVFATTTAEVREADDAETPDIDIPLEDAA